MSISTEGLDDNIVGRIQPKQDILMSLNETDYWNEEIFKVNMILINIDALNLQQNHMKMYLTCESNFSNSIDLDVKEYGGKMKVKFVEFKSNVRPIMTLSIKLPDNRLKYQVKNLIQMLVAEMVKSFFQSQSFQSSLRKILLSHLLFFSSLPSYFSRSKFKETNIKSFHLFEAQYHDNSDYQLKCIKLFLNDLNEMLIGIKTQLYYKTFKRLTEWDDNYLKFLQFTLDDCGIKCVKQVRELSRVDVKSALQEYVNIRDSLSGALNYVS